MERYDALGNIILLDEITDPGAWEATHAHHAEARARAACAGARADQLLCIRREVGPGSREVWRVRVFNADGTRAGMCGNGARCIVRHALEAHDAREIEIAFEDGEGHIARRVHGRVVSTRPFVGEVAMGTPEFDAAGIPVEEDEVVGREGAWQLARVGIGGGAIAEALRSSGAEPWAHVVSVGNPHAVVWCSGVSEALARSIGPNVQGLHAFPKGVNVHLARIQGERMWLESFERGSGYTRACASGACAAVVAGVASGRLNGGATVEMAGGTLGVVWDPARGVVMRGGAERA